VTRPPVANSIHARRQQPNITSGTVCVVTSESGVALSTVLEEPESIADLGDAFGGDVGEQDALRLGGAGQHLTQRIDDPRVAA
jgi:hypothetical protein